MPPTAPPFHNCQTICGSCGDSFSSGALKSGAQAPSPASAEILRVESMRIAKTQMLIASCQLLAAFRQALSAVFSF
jgi:hypothetical protein